MAFDIGKAFGGVRWTEDDEQPWLVAELALWSATSDDEIEDHEVRAVVQTLKQVQGLEDFSEADAQEILEEMERYTSQAAVEDRIAALAEHITDPELRRLSYQLAVYCAASDGELSAEEEDFLRYLQDEFDLDDDTAESLFREVVP